MTAIPVMRPRLPTTDAVAPYLRRIDEVRVYSNCGPLVQELERRYAERLGVGADQVVTCSNATLAIQGAVAVSPATTFHCPSWTFAATPSAVVAAGAGLEFHDVRSSDWTIDAPSPSVGHGVIPVAPFGAQLDLGRWLDWDEAVIDAAASGGAELDLSGILSGWAVVISLHATKVLGAGEGGIAVFGDPERAERFRSYATLGFQGARVSDFAGTNAKMPEAVAAYALAALDDWDRERHEWAHARALVSAAERELGIGSICSSYEGANPYWIVDFGDAERMHRAEESLAAAGIMSRRWWPMPCSMMKAFATYTEVSVPISERLATSTLGLPFFRDLTSVEVARIVSAIAVAQSQDA